jgi:hypothetical protein
LAHETLRLGGNLPARKLLAIESMRLKSWGLAWIGLGALGVMLPPRTAHALSCPRMGALPASGAQDVPQNARVFCADLAQLPAGAPKLLDASGLPVPVRTTSLQPPMWIIHVLTPTALLSPGKYSYDCLGREYSFSVGSSTLDEPPRVPEVTEASRNSSTVFLRVDEQPELVLLDINGASTFDAVSMTGGLADFDEVGIDDKGVGLFRLDADSPCGINWTEPPGAVAEIRLGRMDVAGNFSGWSAPKTISVGSEASESSGCHMSPTPPSNAWLLAFSALGAFAAAARSRRARGATSEAKPTAGRRSGSRCDSRSRHRPRRSTA